MDICHQFRVVAVRAGHLRLLIFGLPLAIGHVAVSTAISGLEINIPGELTGDLTDPPGRPVVSMSELYEKGQALRKHLRKATELY